MQTLTVEYQREKQKVNLIHFERTQFYKLLTIQN